MSYLELANNGKNDWWRYLLGILVILFMWNGIGAIPLGLLAGRLEADKDANTFFNPETLQFEGIDPVIGFGVMMFMSIPLLLGVFLVVRYLHKRSFLTLISSRSKIDWQRYFQGFLVMFAIMAFTSIADGLLFPGTYQFVFQWERFFHFLLLALVLIPIQASTEELLFRGYLMQGIGRLVKTPWIVVGLSSLLFMLPHLFNPEAAPSLILSVGAYTLIGVFLAVITLKSHSLELAMGAHTGVNLFNCFVGSSAVQVFAGIPTVFVRQEDNAINIESLFMMGASFALFYWLVFVRGRVNERVLSVK